MGYTQKSAEEKKKEIDAAMEKIENALPEVFTSKNFRDYLKFQSKFHHYCPFILLIQSLYLNN